MRRFCKKNAIPCHQQGKQPGRELFMAFVTAAAVVLTSVVFGLGITGGSGSSVTAAQKNNIIHHHQLLCQKNE